MDYTHLLQPQSRYTESIRRLEFQDRLDILLEIRLSSVAEPFDKLRTGKDIQCYMGNFKLKAKCVNLTE